ncbi:uncharacterized protein [Solanum lycopersicum]|uniref:uncharacterized protein n=1 Tax=Solanum lycopersicum TaxID=4081 RepID=UPI0037492518
MDISWLMLHAHQVKESSLRKRKREAKRAKSFESGSSKSRLDVQDKPKFEKRFSNQVPSYFTKNFNDRGSNPKPQKGRNVDPPKERPTCGSVSGHMVNDFPNVKSQCKGNGRTQPSGPSFKSPKRNRFYAFKARGEHKNSPSVVMGMLQAFPINACVVLDPGATLCFVTSLVARKFDVIPDVLIEPFPVCTLMGDSVVAKRVYRKCPVMLPNRVTLADLVENDMFDFDIILGLD